eukprot:gene13587-28852_t
MKGNLLSLSSDGDIDDLKKSLKEFIGPQLESNRHDEILIKHSNGVILDSRQKIAVALISGTDDVFLGSCPTSLGIKSIIELELEGVYSELNLLKQEMRFNRDPRLQIFSRNIGGSHSSQSSNQLTTWQSVKAKIREIFPSPLQCFVCSTVNDISIAHIASSRSHNNIHFGTSSNYLNLYSIRNCIPLCGHYGKLDTCHDAYDKHLFSIMYDPILTKYFIQCANEAPTRLKVLAENETSLVAPPGWKPYHRLLAWRAYKSCMEYSYNVDIDKIITMNFLASWARRCMVTKNPTLKILKDIYRVGFFVTIHRRAQLAKRVHRYNLINIYVVTIFHTDSESFH